jgi:hypothetical protein
MGPSKPVISSAAFNLKFLKGFAACAQELQIGGTKGALYIDKDLHARSSI